MLKVGLCLASLTSHTTPISQPINVKNSMPLTTHKMFEVEQHMSRGQRCASQCKHLSPIILYPPNKGLSEKRCKVDCVKVITCIIKFQGEDATDRQVHHQQCG